MTKPLGLAIVLALLLLLAAGCGRGGPALTAGTVSDKQYDAAKWVPEVVIPQAPILVGKDYIPQPPIIIPGHTTPERWRIQLEGEVHGNQVHDWVSVDRTEYDSIRVGQDWPRTGER